ncbi:hypothetical protein [Streptomyces sp. NPDC094032]|uniref:hypothetical protein n=1 Tax=Streptomyces sp. NPDC094032 TaxID=3155308 RepID=UPI003328EE5F
MSAHAIPWHSLLLAFAATATLAWTAAGHRRGPLAIATGLTAVQGALHLIFGAGEQGSMGAMGAMGGKGSTAPMAAMDHMGSTDPMAAMAALHHMGTTDPMSAMSAMDPMASMAATAHTAHTMTMGAAPGSATGMLLAHLLAALACGLWLARGEAALFVLARAVAATAFTPLRLALAAVRVLAPVPPALRPARTAPYTRRLRGVVLAHAVSRRGPPGRAVPRATALGAHV